MNFLESRFKMLFHANFYSINFLSGKGLCIYLILSKAIDVLGTKCKQKTLWGILDYSLRLLKYL